MKYGFVSLVLIFFSLNAQAQMPSNRIRPGVMYHAGDTVRSPRLGLSTQVPDGWVGVLPRDTEVFLLMPENNSFGEIYVVANLNTNLQTQQQRWETGMDLTEGLRLQPDGEISTRGPDVLSAMGKMVGNNANSHGKIYLEARCSPAGFCISYVALADLSSFEYVKAALQTFVDNTIFREPSNESPYKNFDWKEFLSGKILLAIGYEGNSKRQDEVRLCADGTFHSRITRTGIFKDQAEEYQGKKQGAWEVTGVGERADITFTFDKLPSVEVAIEARDEEIYVNGERYFVGESDECR